MSTAFEVDNSVVNTDIATPFSTQIPQVEGTYDLTPDQVLLDQEQHESAVRSYPRRLPIAIKQAYGALVEDTADSYSSTVWQERAHWHWVTTTRKSIRH